MASSNHLCFLLYLQPRCEVLPEEVNKACELRPDPKDSCCKVMHCPDPNDIGHDAKPVGLSFDGCVHKKESYTKVKLVGRYKVRFIHVIDKRSVLFGVLSSI